MNQIEIQGYPRLNQLNATVFGGSGSDIFIWKPGDGSDFFDGGRRQDAIVFSARHLSRSLQRRLEDIVF